MPRRRARTGKSPSGSALGPTTRSGALDVTLRARYVFSVRGFFGEGRGRRALFVLGVVSCRGGDGAAGCWCRRMPQNLGAQRQVVMGTCGAGAVLVPCWSQNRGSGVGGGEQSTTQAGRERAALNHVAVGSCTRVQCAAGKSSRHCRLVWGRRIAGLWAGDVQGKML